MPATLQRFPIGLAFCVLAVACNPSGPASPPTPSAEPPPAPSAEPPPAPPKQALGSKATDAQQAALQRARELAKGLGVALKTRLQVALQTGGPSAAVEVCADQAQAMTHAAQAAGARVGRASLRLRNPRNVAPPWVQAWLQQQGERAAAGVAGFERIEAGHARIVKPITVEGVCLSCHGPAQAIPQEVRQTLAKRYPSDQATGYAAGDLRGALWAEVQIDNP